MLTKTVASSVLIIGILVIRAFFQKKVSPIFIYALWLFAALRLLMPGMLFFSSISIMNTDLWHMGSALLAEEEERQDREYKGQQYRAYYEQKMREMQDMSEQESSNGEEEMLSGSSVGGSQAVSDQTESGMVTLDQVENSQIIDQKDSFQEKTDSIELKWQWAGTLFGKIRQLAGMVWIAGMVITAMIFLWQNLSLYHYLRSVRREFTKAETGRRKLPVFMVGDKLSSPCLFGILPAVYIPEGSIQTEDEQQLAFVLEHELTHYRHGDHIWAFVRILCLIINWYNPLAWLTAKLSIQDGELACDAGCIRRLGESKRCVYGEALLKIIRESGEREKPLKAATMMTSEKKFMKKRIERIAERKKNSLLALTVMVGFALLIAGCTYTGTTQMEEAKPDQASGSVETNPVKTDKEEPDNEEVDNEIENGADAGQREAGAVGEAENDRVSCSGKAVVIKGEGEGLNGNLQGMVFLLLPGSDKAQTNEKEVVLLPGDLYMPDLNGNGAVLSLICQEYTAQEILEMLNRNLELSLEEIEVWGYETLIRKVDDAGGISIDVAEDEIVHINNYQLMLTGNGKLAENEVTQSGVQTLNGIQAAAYLQIRYLPIGYSRVMGRWAQVIPALLEKEDLEIISCQENYFSGFGQSAYVESLPKSYLLCLEWEKEIENLHENLYPEQSYHASDYVKETDQMMRKQAEAAVERGREEAYQISYLFDQYMGQNPFMISLITGTGLDPETENVWRQTKVWISQTGLVVSEEQGKAVYAVSLVFEDAGILALPEHTRENPVTVQRFLYMTKKEDGWYVDGMLHNDLPSKEWWKGEPQEWEVCDYGFSDEDDTGTVTHSQEEYDEFVKQAGQKISSI